MQKYIFLIVVCCLVISSAFATEPQLQNHVPESTELTKERQDISLEKNRTIKKDTLIRGTAKMDESFLPILALNYCNFSLSKIISYNDRVVLDEEYNNIINNINLNKIKDDETFDIIKMLLDTIFQFVLNEHEKEILQAIYDEKSEEALNKTLKQSMSIVTKSNIPTNPAQLAITLVSVTKECSGAYTDYRNHLEDYKKKLDKDLWKLDKKAMLSIHKAHKNFLTTFRTILKRYNAPDEWRLSNGQLEDYIEIFKEQDNEKRYRVLTRPEQESNLKYFPLYWYLRAVTASQLGIESDVTYCYSKFMSLYQGFFRDDSFYSSILMTKTAAEDYSNRHDQLRADIRTIIDHDKKDWEKKLFAAGMFLKYEMYPDAMLYLQANIDDNNAVSISRKLLSDAVYAQNDSDSLENLIKKSIKDDTISNQDIMYMIGKLDNKSIVNKFKKEILEIHGVVDSSIFGKDNFLLQIPQRWVLHFSENLSIELKTNSQDTSRASKITRNQDHKVVIFQFDEVLDLDDILVKGKEFPLSFSLKTSYGTLYLEGSIVPKLRMEEKGKFRSKAESTVDYSKTLVKNMYGDMKSGIGKLIDRDAAKGKHKLAQKPKDSTPKETREIRYAEFELKKITYLNSSFNIESGDIVAQQR